MTIVQLYVKWIIDERKQFWGKKRLTKHTVDINLIVIK